MPKPTLLALAILAILLAIVLIARLTLGQSQPPSAVASAILTGQAHARFATGDDAEDGGLADDEAAAGAMWAKQHVADDPAECRRYSPAFQKAVRTPKWVAVRLSCDCCERRDGERGVH